jgi:hypothetical protein
MKQRDLLIEETLAFSQRVTADAKVVKPTAVVYQNLRAEAHHGYADRKARHGTRSHSEASDEFQGASRPISTRARRVLCDDHGKGPRHPMELGGR